ncbi:MAG: hypothetical protein FD143_3782 [Ignavibacteria bacterium]|nr:MAG: hypothetical protein FD143_3782 [Ignavibacteria bacterium]
MEDITVKQEMEYINELDGIIQDWLNANEGVVSYYTFIGYLEELKTRLLTEEDEEN